MMPMNPISKRLKQTMQAFCLKTRPIELLIGVDKQT